MARRRNRWSSWRHLAAALVAAVIAALVLIAPTAARADGLADEAELHFQLGAEAYQKADFRAALQHFLHSNRLVANRNVVFNIARAFEQLRRFADAHRYYVDAREGESDPTTIAELDAAVARVAPNVGVLRVETTPPGATIYIDRKDLGSRGRAPRPLAVPAGKYRVLVELEGYEPAESELVEAQLGREVKIALALERIVGTVQAEVEGTAGVTVRLDDERAPSECVAPCTFLASPGSHTVYFTREGFQTVARPVMVVADGAVRTTARLSPVTGSVLVEADERDAVVEIDGRPMGFTPAVIQGVAAGLRRVKVSLPGYAPSIHDVEVKANQQTELLGLRLTPLREVSAVSRVTESIDDAPSSLTIIDGRELRAFGYPTIVEALRGVRGVYVSYDHAYHSAGIRGLGEPFDYGNRVLVLSDGHSLNDNLLNSSYIGSDGRVDLHDVNRIEVVRGPGSLLYGTGAFSGLVNLVTRGRESPSSVHAAIGTYDNAVARGRAGAQYNFSEDAGVWASASGSRSDGRDLEVAPTDPGTGPARVVVRRVDAFEAAGTAGKAWWGAATAQWSYHQRRQVIPVGVYATRIGDPRTRWTDQRAMGELRFEPKLTERVQLFTRAHANHYHFGAESAYEAPPVRPAIERYDGSWFGGEARVVITPVDALRLTIGGEGQLHPQATIQGGEAGEGDEIDPATLYVDVDEPYNLGAGYAVVEASPAPWLRLSGGARVDVYSTFGPIVVPRAAVILRPAAGSTLKVMGGRAFRAPSIYEQFYSDGGLSQVVATDEARGLSLGPESVFSGEVEYSQRFLESWVALGAVHVSHVEGIINAVPDTPGADVVRLENSDAAALTIGGEVEIRREWRQGFMLSGFYGYQDARYLDVPEANPRLINAPRHLAAVRGVAPLVEDLASIGARATLEAPRRIDLVTSDQTSTAVVADITLSGRAKRAGISYVLGVYNVFDWSYSVPAANTFASRTSPQSGRTLLLDVVLTYP